MCLVCREHLPQTQLFRLFEQDGKIWFDPTGKAPGRGAYVCASAACIGKLAVHPALTRSFKGAVKIEAEQIERIQAAGPQKVLQYVGLAKRAGNLLTGMDAVLAGLQQQEISLLILAEDAGDTTVRKVRHSIGSNAVPVWIGGKKQEYARLLGRGDTAVLAITDHSLAEAMLGLIERAGLISGEDRSDKW